MEITDRAILTALMDAVSLLAETITGKRLSIKIADDKGEFVWTSGTTLARLEGDQNRVSPFHLGGSTSPDLKFDAIDSQIASTSVSDSDNSVSAV